jgi:hypothetical protein
MTLFSLKIYSLSAGQEILRLLWNTIFHYRVHKTPSLNPLVSKMNTVRVFILCFVITIVVTIVNMIGKLLVCSDHID